MKEDNTKKQKEKEDLEVQLSEVKQENNELQNNSTGASSARNMSPE